MVTGAFQIRAIKQSMGIRVVAVRSSERVTVLITSLFASLPCKFIFFPNRGGEPFRAGFEQLRYRLLYYWVQIKSVSVLQRLMVESIFHFFYLIFAGFEYSLSRCPHIDELCAHGAKTRELKRERKKSRKQQEETIKSIVVVRTTITYHEYLLHTRNKYRRTVSSHDFSK